MDTRSPFTSDSDRASSDGDRTDTERGRSRAVSKPLPPLPKTPGPKTPARKATGSGRVVSDTASAPLEPYVSPRVEQRWGTESEKRLYSEARLRRMEEAAGIEKQGISPTTTSFPADCKPTSSASHSRAESIANATTLNSSSIMSDAPSDVTEAMAGLDIGRADSTATTATFASGASTTSLLAINGASLGTLTVTNEAPEQDQGPECLWHGDALVMSSRPLPPGTVFGFDLNVVTIGKDSENFGVRDIPEGLHLVWARNNSPIAETTGHWFFSKHAYAAEPGVVHVRSWNIVTETIEEEEVKAEEFIARKEIASIYPRLLPYNLSGSAHEKGRPGLAGIQSGELWKDLTFAIKAPLLNRILKMPENKWRISSEDEIARSAIYDAPGRLSTGRNGYRHINLEGRKKVMNFLFDRNSTSTVINRDSTEEVITKQHNDSTHFIDYLVTNFCSNHDTDEIIGELQFAYVTGIMLGNIECQEHWCAMLKTVFRAYDMCSKDPVLMARFVMAVHSQLIFDHTYVEGSIFDHNPGFKTELYKLLCKFRARLDEKLVDKSNVPEHERTAEVGTAFLKLEEWLWKWNWDLRKSFVKRGKFMLEDGEVIDAEISDYDSEEDQGEYAPVIVDLDENGRERGLF